jgi:hypothetical protein
MRGSVREEFHCLIWSGAPPGLPLLAPRTIPDERDGNRRTNPSLKPKDHKILEPFNIFCNIVLFHSREHQSEVPSICRLRYTLNLFYPFVDVGTAHQRNIKALQYQTTFK